MSDHTDNDHSIHDEASSEPAQSVNPSSSRKKLAAAAVVVATAAVIAAAAIAGSDGSAPAANQTTTAETSAVATSSLPPLAPATTTGTTTQQTVAVKIGADVTYGGLQFTNTDKENAIKVTGVEPHVVGGDVTQVNVADVVLVYPVPENPTQLEKGWPPKAYPPENVFYAPGTFDLAPGETTQILLRLARTVKTPVKIEGFDVTYMIGDKEYVATVDNALTLDI